MLVIINVLTHIDLVIFVLSESLYYFNEDVNDNDDSCFNIKEEGSNPHVRV